MTRCVTTANNVPLYHSSQMDRPLNFIKSAGTAVGTIGGVVNGGPNGNTPVRKVFVPVLNQTGWVAQSLIDCNAAATAEVTAAFESTLPQLKNTVLLPVGFSSVEIMINGESGSLKMRNITGEAPENKSYAYIAVNPGSYEPLPLGDSTHSAPEGAIILVANETKNVSVMMEWEWA